jgi:tetratricopeptide (TPR) repeat protein
VLSPIVGMRNACKRDCDSTKSLQKAQRAQELDPLSPDIISELANVHFIAGQYDESIVQFQKTLDLNPNIPVLRAMLGLAYAMKGMYPKALVEYDKSSDQDKVTAAGNQFVAGMLGWVYAVSGRRTAALKIAREFKDLSAHAHVDFYWPGVIYVGLGDKDEAFRLLEKGYQEHGSAMLYLAGDPVLVRAALRLALQRPAAPDGTSAARVMMTSLRGLSANLPLSRYARFARDPGGILRGPLIDCRRTYF